MPGNYGQPPPDSQNAPEEEQRPAETLPISLEATSIPPEMPFVSSETLPVSAAERFINLARKGYNQWWRYFIAIMLISFGWLVLGSLPIPLVAFLRAGSDIASVVSERGTLLGVDPLVNYVLLNISVIALLIAVIVVVPLVHSRSAKTLVTPRSWIDFRRMGQGFGLFLAMLCIIETAAFVVQPTNYTFQFDLVPFLILVPLALILTPLQCAAEELYFRGYFLQGFGLLLKRPLLAAAASGFIFMVPHLANPEVGNGVAAMALLYFCMGFFLAIITLRDGRLELAIGVHAANNLFNALFVTYPDAALNTPALFATSEFNPFISLISFVVVATFFYVLTFRTQLIPATPESAE